MSNVEPKPEVKMVEKEMVFDFGTPEVKKKSKGIFVEYDKGVFMDNVPDDMVEAVEKTFNFMKEFDAAFVKEAESQIVTQLNENEDEDKVFVKCGWGPSHKAGKGERTKHGELAISGTRSRNASAPGSDKTITKPFFVTEHKSPYLAGKEEMKDLQSVLMEKLNKY